MAASGFAALKARIHAARFPIKSRAGLAGMGLLYFTIPLVAGYFVMRWTDDVARANLGERGEKLLAAKAAWGAPVVRATPRAGGGGGGSKDA
jgi:hypothetical protein